jgi:putative effector of murein hydrolase LrgA (UPF0299 family)
MRLLQIYVQECILVTLAHLESLTQKQEHFTVSGVQVSILGMQFLYLLIYNSLRKEYSA